MRHVPRPSSTSGRRWAVNVMASSFVSVRSIASASVGIRGLPAVSRRVSQLDGSLARTSASIEARWERSLLAPPAREGHARRSSASGPCRAAGSLRTPSGPCPRGRKRGPGRSPSSCRCRDTRAERDETLPASDVENRLARNGLRRREDAIAPAPVRVIGVVTLPTRPHSGYPLGPTVSLRGHVRRGSHRFCAWRSGSGRSRSSAPRWTSARAVEASTWGRRRSATRGSRSDS